VDFVEISKCTAITCGETVKLLRTSGWSTGTAAGIIFQNSPEYPYIRIDFTTYLKKFHEQFPGRQCLGFVMNWWADPVSDFCGCPVNMYMGPRNCMKCPSDSYSPITSTGIDACTCNAGWTGAVGGSCLPCVAGTYKPYKGNSSCLSCLANSNSPSTSISPTACRCNA